MRNANLPEFFGTRPNSVKSQSTASMRSGHGKGEYAPRGALCVGAGQMGSNDLLPYAPLAPEGKLTSKSQVRRVREEEHPRPRTYSPPSPPRPRGTLRRPRPPPLSPRLPILIATGYARGPAPPRAVPAPGSAAGWPARARTTTAPPYSARGTATRAAGWAGEAVSDRTSHGWDSAHRRTGRAAPAAPSRHRCRSPRRTASPHRTPTPTPRPPRTGTHPAGPGHPPSPPPLRGTSRRPRLPRIPRPVPRLRGAPPSARGQGGPRRHPRSCSRRRPLRR